MAQQWNRQAVYQLPVVHVSFALRRLALAESSISLFQNVTALRIHIPADRGAGGIHIDDAGFDVADLLASIGMEKHIRILPVRSDENRIALDLLQSFRFLRGREVAHA